MFDGAELSRDVRAAMTVPTFAVLVLGGVWVGETANGRRLAADAVRTFYDADDASARRAAA